MNGPFWEVFDVPLDKDHIVEGCAVEVSREGR